jgi:transcriptional regulator with XRE-family HTH domain
MQKLFDILYLSRQKEVSNMSMGSRILEARTRKGLTQEALAEKIGVTKGAVANYENSVSFPKIDILFKLFEVLEVDANYLYQDYVNFTDNSKLSDEEIDLIIDYRNITQNGKRMVRTVLNEELRRKDDEGCPPSKPVSMIVNTFF